MKIILAVVCITFVYVFSMVNLEAYRNQQLDKFNPNNKVEEVLPPSSGNSSIVEEEDNTSKIKVTLIGEILHPGTYTLKSDSTFDDLIKLGGLTQKSADESCYNLDLILKDQTTYYIPKNTDFKVSINTAKKDTLMQLKGIGDSMADRIIKYRDDKMKESHVGFEYLDEIKEVPGIKELTFNKIRDYIKL